MKQLEKFKEKKKLYYIAALRQHNFFDYTLALGWNDTNAISSELIDSDNLPDSISFSMERYASVCSSIFNVLDAFSPRSILLGRSSGNREFDRTLVMSSPCPKFSKDIQIVIECKSNEIIDKCKELGIWDH